jgi:hypothetical protein
MSMLVDEKQAEIAGACHRYGIERRFTFGSSETCHTAESPPWACCLAHSFLAAR